MEKLDEKDSEVQTKPCIPTPEVNLHSLTTLPQSKHSEYEAHPLVNHAASIDKTDIVAVDADSMTNDNLNQITDAINKGKILHIINHNDATKKHLSTIMGIAHKHPNINEVMLMHSGDGYRSLSFDKDLTSQKAGAARKLAIAGVSLAKVRSMQRRLDLRNNRELSRRGRGGFGSGAVSVGSDPFNFDGSEMASPREIAQLEAQIAQQEAQRWQEAMLANNSQLIEPVSEMITTASNSFTGTLADKIFHYWKEYTVNTEDDIRSLWAISLKLTDLFIYHNEIPADKQPSTAAFSNFVNEISAVNPNLKFYTHGDTSKTPTFEKTSAGAAYKLSTSRTAAGHGPPVTTTVDHELASYIAKDTYKPEASSSTTIMPGNNQSFSYHSFALPQSYSAFKFQFTSALQTTVVALLRNNSDSYPDVIGGWQHKIIVQSISLPYSDIEYVQLKGPNNYVTFSSPKDNWADNTFSLSGFLGIKSFAVDVFVRPLQLYSGFLAKVEIQTAMLSSEYEEISDDMLQVSTETYAPTDSQTVSSTSVSSVSDTTNQLAYNAFHMSAVGIPFGTVYSSVSSDSVTTATTYSVSGTSYTTKNIVGLPTSTLSTANQLWPNGLSSARTASWQLSGASGTFAYEFLNTLSLRGVTEINTQPDIAQSYSVEMPTMTVFETTPAIQQDSTEFLLQGTKLVTVSPTFEVGELFACPQVPTSSDALLPISYNAGTTPVENRCIYSIDFDRLQPQPQATILTTTQFGNQHQVVVQNEFGYPVTQQAFIFSMSFDPATFPEEGLFLQFGLLVTNQNGSAADKYAFHLYKQGSRNEEGSRGTFVFGDSIVEGFNGLYPLSLSLSDVQPSSTSSDRNYSIGLVRESFLLTSTGASPALNVRFLMLYTLTNAEGKRVTYQRISTQASFD